MASDNTKFVLNGDNYCSPGNGWGAVPVVCNSRMVVGCMTVSGSATLVATSSGAFLKDGIAVGKVVRGTDFQSGTVVQSITDGTHLVLSKTMTGTHVGQIVYFDHPSYPGAPSRPDSELDNYPITNLVTRDSRASWKLTQPGSAFNNLYVDVDLGTDCEVGLIFLLGCIKTSYYPNGAIRTYYRTDAQGYGDGTFTGWTEWTGGLTWPTVTRCAKLRDTATTKSGRYWRLHFPNANLSPGWTIGRMLMAFAWTDLGFLWGPGSKRSPILSRLAVNGGDGSPFVTETGSERTKWAMTFPRLNGDEAGMIHGLSTQLYPFVMRDGFWGSYYEVVPVSPVDLNHVFGRVGDLGMSTDWVSTDLVLQSL